jgi:hypothetical protein
MRIPAICLLLAPLLAAPGFGAELEVSTGFLIGPKYDSRSIYIRTSAAEQWQKSGSTPEFRKSFWGRLLGVTLQASDPPLERVAGAGLQLVRLNLQSPDSSAFAPDGSLPAAEKQRLGAILSETAAQGIAIELVLFHPAQDQNFDSPEAILDAVRLLTDWLIDSNYRHVLLNPAADWTCPGWDFDSFIPHNLERIANGIRDRFQARRTDFALAVVLSARNQLNETSTLVQDADVLVVEGDALRMNPRRLDRPMLVLESEATACAAALARFAGCLLAAPAEPDNLRALASLALKSPKP